ncbi:MAG: PHP domain-containing protein [Bryobacteraceae bacterium]
MIDLHTHTDQSDGTVPPAELVTRAMELGLEALGVTDHDTMVGCDLAAVAAREAGLDFVPGIELSTRFEAPLIARLPGVEKMGRLGSVHILGYFLEGDPAPEFRDFLWTQQEGRRKRNVDLIAKLNSLGVDIQLEEVQALGRNLTGRPHFAKILLKKGYVTKIQDAFDIYLADSAQAAVEREEPSMEEGVERIRKAGGMASLAHPVRLPFGKDPMLLSRLLEVLMEHGLEAIEVYHSEQSPEESALYLELARKHKLIVTGGTDYHGDNKPGIALGTGKNHNVLLGKQFLDDMRQRHVPAA